MTRSAPTTLVVFALLPLMLATTSAPLPNSRTLPKEASHALAGISTAPGDTVWIVINPVKAEKRAQWEQFVRVFWGAGLQSKDAKTRASFTSTRVLLPTKANPDGSFSYIFIMDPHIPGNSYGIQSLAQLVLPEAEASRVVRLMEDARSAPPTLLAVTEATAAALGRK